MAGDKMIILVLGSGGRESAVAWKIAQSPRVKLVLVAPGNGGTAAPASGAAAEVRNVPHLGVGDNARIVRYARANRVDLVFVGPEVPLVNGVADALAEAGIACFGPSAAAARIEGSKAFSKALMRRAGVPTAAFGVFTDHALALAHVRAEYAAGRQVVIKASGLAAGKGVLLPESLAAAEEQLRGVMLEGAFGDAGDEVVIEELLEGPEASMLAFTDGRDVVVMPAAQDHKRVFEGDRGPNTGGMGAYAPAPVATPEIVDFVRAEVLQRTVDAMAAEGKPYRGVLYAGMMLTPTGPKCLEFNCRFGDPETQVLLPLLQTDLVEVMLACLRGDEARGCTLPEGPRLADLPVRWASGAAATVVCASQGYPGAYPKGRRISGLGAAAAVDGVRVFHAGTRACPRTEGTEGTEGTDGTARTGVETAGGRVLAVTGTGASLPRALATAYAGVSQIAFDGMQFRRDIAHRSNVPAGCGRSAAERSIFEADQRPVRVAVLGSTNGTDMQALVEAMRAGGALEGKAVIEVVVTNRAKAGIVARARNCGVDCAVLSARGKTRRAYDAEVTAELERRNVDLVLLVGWMRILGDEFVDKWWNRCLNVHPSLLPAYGGGMDLDVHQCVLDAGDRATGCTVHFVTHEVDGGAVVEQRSCAVAADETAESLKRKVQALEGEALVSAVARFYASRLAEVTARHPNPRARGNSQAAGEAKLSYASAGVSIDAGDALVRAIAPLCKATRRPGCAPSLGGFGGIFDLGAAGYGPAGQSASQSASQSPDDTLLVGATDGVGTKLLLAERCGQHGTIGQDLVAMCVNDLVVQGAEPLFFLDYYATGRLSVGTAAQVVEGIARGCSLAGCALIGGETAEMPQMYEGERYDLAGFAVGAVRRRQLLPRTGPNGGVAAGDVVLALPSAGVHSNGFSLVRRLVKVLGLDYDAPPPYPSGAKTLVEDLLTPTKIYVKQVLPALRSGDVAALAHITGGGLTENVPRVMPEGLGVEIDLASWRLPPVFDYIARSNKVDRAEMLRTFNCGVGMVLLVPAAREAAVRASVEKMGETCLRIGVCTALGQEKGEKEVVRYVNDFVLGSHAA
jgi:phosphoribosylamine--glycine ligase/phosphoribosylglycinamide formyltransferase/phosphoribosylformylglycinamidine cyclo-ligase/phosphoribosylamine--glycine ligase/phosphoribosylformylglycinamidine cyclo-ligase